MLADDHPLVLSGLQSRLAREPDMNVLACCADGAAALQAVEQHRPDIVVLDQRMPQLDGQAMLREFASRGLCTREILLAAELRATQVAEAARLGVRGLLLKDMALATLVQCIRTAYGGGHLPEHRSMSSVMAQWPRQTRGDHDPTTSLTARDLQVVCCVARGLRNREIATELAINEGTVKIPLHNACRKLNVEGRLALGIYARERAIA